MNRITFYEFMNLAQDEIYTFTGIVEWLDKIKYYKDGKLHCLEGPAIRYTGCDLKEWYLFGVRYSEQEWKIERIRSSEEFKDVLKYKNCGS